MYGEAFEGLDKLIYTLAVGTLFGLIFGVWKVIDILVWVVNHVQVTVQ